MDPDGSKRVTEILRAALLRDPAERQKYIHQACIGDPLLEAEIERRLETASAQTMGGETSAAVRTQRLLSDDLSGARVGPYELLKRIGKGGMGSVYAAHRVDQEFRQYVAVKMVKPGMENEEILGRFRLERQVLASLDHPNIARLMDGGSTDNGLPYLVMEYVEGTPLDQYCREQKLSINDRLKLFATVCSAVQYAHQSLVVHRDIKPGNIMVSSDGVPKLLDFGIAKLLDPENQMDSAMTKSAGHPMTLEYASPEQVKGEAITTASDVYALGVMLYVLLTGRHPFASVESSMALQWAILEREPEPPSTAVQRREPDGDFADGTRDRTHKHLLGDLDMITLMAMRKEPPRRYASVQHFADDIGRHLQGLPVRAHKDTVPYRINKFVRRHTLAVAAATFAVVALIASSIASWTFYRESVRDRKTAEGRFSDVRQLARFVLFDFDQVIEAGVTPARKAVLEKATEYLQRLEKDRGSDPSLERELVEGYLKVGDLQGNPFAANLGDRKGALASYERAVRIIEAAKHPDPQLMAQAQTKLADLLSLGGAPKDAIDRYRKAAAMFQSAPASDLASRTALLDLSRKIAFNYYQIGDFAAALKEYEAYLSNARAVLAVRPDITDMRGAVALGEVRIGELHARMGNVQRGLTEMQSGLTAYEDLGAKNPGSLNAQRPIATTSTLIGDILVQEGRHRDAAAYFRKALRVADAEIEKDPKNLRTQRDLVNALGRLADAVAKSGDMDDARTLTRRALSVLKPLVARDNPSEYDMYQYAWILLTTPVVELRNAAIALPYAEKLANASNREDPRTLDLLARGYAGVGDYQKAVDTENTALRLLPTGGDSDLRKELEENLKEFRSHATGSASRQ